MGERVGHRSGLDRRSGRLRAVAASPKRRACPLGDPYPGWDTEGGSVLGRCELAKLGEGAPVAAYERQLLGTKGRLPYWWPSPIPLCEVAPRGG